MKFKRFIAHLRLNIWLSRRLLFNRKILFAGSAPLSFLGLVLGVAALVASMSVMRGFESSLKQAMIDVTGDLQIVKKSKLIESWDEFSSEIKSIDPSIQKMARFAYTEAVLAHQGKVSGVLIQGFDFDQVTDILNLKPRLRSGQLDFSLGHVVIGQGLAKKFDLQVAEEVFLAVSLATPFEGDDFERQVRTFKIAAVLDFGKNDWNERLVLAHLKDFQELTQIGDRYTGAFIKIKDSSKAPELSQKIESQLGSRYVVSNWFEVNKNLFKAVHYEMVIIFFVVFLIVVVAAFNISSTLYVLIRQRYYDIAVLKALGASQKNMQMIFVIQGLWVAICGCLVGFTLGYLLSQGFMLLQNYFPLISGSVYKIDRIDIRLSWIDFLLIFMATTLACFLATYPPARKGSQLTIIEGLRED